MNGSMMCNSLQMVPSCEDYRPPARGCRWRELFTPSMCPSCSQCGHEGVRRGHDGERGSHPEGGRTSAESPDEAHEVAEEGDGAGDEGDDHDVGRAVGDAREAVVAQAALHHRGLNHVEDGHRVHLVASQHVNHLHRYGHAGFMRALPFGAHSAAVKTRLHAQADCHVLGR